LIYEQAGSGQSVAAFCRERQLYPSHFYWWKKRPGVAVGPDAAGREIPRTEFVEVRLTPAMPEGVRDGPASRAEVVVRPMADPPPVGDGRVEVVPRDGRRLRVGPGSDAALVQAPAAVLESAA
jgi:hypothetical protein